MEKTGKTSQGLRKYVCYGLGFLGDSCYYQFITTFLLVFLTGPAGLSPKDAGTVGSFIVLADAFCSVSLTVRVMTLLLDSAGFDGQLAEQSASALSMLDVCFVLLPGITSLLGAACMFFYRVNREGHMLVREALDRRAAGEEPLNAADTTKIEAMLR